ncbi:hypothetical protein ASPZODRAFT_71287 [Penicilliopsis zonata CBS 506.65]|uniref:Uncharacterized protein n=1 Tax=Penicilliopsis zonata CBS 506.65 TaxID=1073090 RepID=A0A1L9SC67_9EURO|nr:hypothetical protein ASPZODRAFT_71287 [Penicilliopsis zonata CBS 506.65]OJJ44795.1 hypothetical protein ASPZODRAFT_71287 [Penicilliopsis zonata CBS 506.65]
MLSLVLTVLFVHVAIYLVNTIGASTIDNLVWLLYLRLPTSASRNAQESNRLKREVVQLKREMNNTSSQDEFAKWAKLRRKHDKTLEEHEAINKDLSSQKTSLEWAVKAVRWLSTNGLKLFLQFYYSKTAVFYLPPGWLPYYVEWVLSFPRAPLGSVSIQVWSSVCVAVIAAVTDIVTSVLSQITSQRGQPVPAAGADDKKTQ